MTAVSSRKAEVGQNRLLLGRALGELSTRRLAYEAFRAELTPEQQSMLSSRHVENSLAKAIESALRFQDRPTRPKVSEFLKTYTPLLESSLLELRDAGNPNTLLQLSIGTFLQPQRGTPTSKPRERLERLTTLLEEVRNEFSPSGSVQAQLLKEIDEALKSLKESYAPTEKDTLKLLRGLVRRTLYAFQSDIGLGNLTEPGQVLAEELRVAVVDQNERVGKVAAALRDALSV